MLAKRNVSNVIFPLFLPKTTFMVNLKFVGKLKVYLNFDDRSVVMSVPTLLN